MAKQKYVIAQSKTLIYLHAIEPLTASWAVFNAAGQVEQSIFNGHLSQLIPRGAISVFAPPDQILIKQITLPKLSRARLLQALPFALEEQLIDDVNDLHFALAPEQQEGAWPVAIVAKKTMDTWLAFLKQFNLYPSQLTSGLFALPWQERVVVGIDGDIAAVRTGKYNGFACDKSNLNALLENAADIPACSLSHEALKMQRQPTINLLQGVYQARHGQEKIKKTWRLAAGLFGAWVLLVLFSNLVSFFILHHQTSLLESEINAIYQKNFPEAQAVVEPRENMEKKLKDLITQANKNNFLAILAEVGKCFAEYNVQIKHLDFRDDQLTVDVLAARFDDIDALIQVLTKQGLIAKQQNAAIVGTQVKATILIQRGAA